MEPTPKYIHWLEQLSLADLPKVGGKNASLGELYQQLTPKGIHVPNGFVINAQAYWALLQENRLTESLEKILKSLDTDQFKNLQQVGKKCRRLLSTAKLPIQVRTELTQAFRKLKRLYKGSIQVAVRSSATAEDLPHASFAGQQESFLNIETEEELLRSCQACYASLFTDRAIKYREDNHFKHMDVALSIGIQKMVRSDKACAGVSFTLDTESGFRDMVSISGSWGLGENVVKGRVSPDEFWVFKPTLAQGKRAIFYRHLGDKEETMVYASKKMVSKSPESKTINKSTPSAKRQSYVLSDEEIEKLARWSVEIEKHYKYPMDIEWAKDGTDGELYIVQARPETVHTRQEPYKFFEYRLLEKGKPVVKGKNVGSKIGSGLVRILHSPADIDKLQEGEVLVTTLTNPDWDPILKKASAIITDRGGRTSHAAIVARESGAIAVVGTGNATKVLKNGQKITISCIDGKGIVYDGWLQWESKEIDTRQVKLPKTQVMFILSDPDQAFKLSFLPNQGVGLMRLEFVINNSIKIHPLALVNYRSLKDKEVKKQIEHLTRGYDDKGKYFIDKLSQAVAMIAAAFYPKEVIVRMSDFKTNEYAELIGGHEFEPQEENPMLGWRGASRYYSPAYRDGFQLECEAMRIVRNEMGLTNVKLMIPFCRTVEEGKQVLEIMKDFALAQGENGLEIYMMVEVPSNVIQGEDFADIFDGFSIGSNDLTQLTLGIDRDSEVLADLFDTENPAVKEMIKHIILVAKRKELKIGLCGQAASDLPEYASFLVECGIDSVSFNPDALIKGINTITAAEKNKTRRQVTVKKAAME